ncbi:oxygenase MpaB family protein [Gordonia amicalis]|nr:oxygenase MpaB family protein [Gordonia amicalis]MCZ4652354.1 oxygenase MpaB family protein [Gordonia amicalis]
MSAVLSGRSTDDDPAFPSAVTYDAATSNRRLQRARALVRRATGKDLYPEPEQLRTFAEDMFRTDPVAERFVDEVYGTLGPEAARALLDKALTDGLDSIENPPPALVELFEEFETVPDWVDPELIAEGEEIWRRWGTGLFSVAGGITLEMYTEAAVAKPLSLAGGYAGDNALRRFLETSRFWIDVSQPGALLTPGSAGRATAMRVRVMHVWVRRTVAKHPEWDVERWGEPISQSYQLLTLLGGSVVPASALWLTGVQTTPREIRVLLHYQRYLGHLLGVRTQWFPETIADSLRLLAFVNDAQLRRGCGRRRTHRVVPGCVRRREREGPRAHPRQVQRHDVRRVLDDLHDADDALSLRHAQSGPGSRADPVATARRDAHRDTAPGLPDVPPTAREGDVSPPGELAPMAVLGTPCGVRARQEGLRR